MKREGYYSSGDFAGRAHITKKTLRYYDAHDILRPSLVTESGARFYTDDDFARLQQILLLKFLGFSLGDIREMTIGDTDYRLMGSSLNLQLKMVEDRIEQLQLVERTIRETIREISQEHAIDWEKMLDLIHMTEMETSLKNQYKNASNISARISLHSLYSENREGWFPWLFRNLDLREGQQVLEVGCGNGALWAERTGDLPQEVRIMMTDISDGMLRDVRRSISDRRFSFLACDVQELPFADESFDLVVANYVLFYCEDIPRALSELRRVLRPGGTLVCSSYGRHHMQEISRLVSDFDDRIVLAAENLYERFGKENGEALLRPFFREISWTEYEDALLVTEAEPLIAYILSCHGNQNPFISERYNDFRTFLKTRMGKGFRVTKEAGFFRAVRS